MSPRETPLKLRHSRRKEGISGAEMKDAFEDLNQFMAAAIKTVNDDEVARLASKDDSF